jgi:protocatechuate 3,4-dioxygenase, alpha subunit
MLDLTPSQTVGPFFFDGLLGTPQNVLVEPGTAADHIRVEGRVLDGSGGVVGDAMIEIWQADAQGHYRHPADAWGPDSETGFTGFGRSGTDESGHYWFETIKPGPVPLEGGGLQAPHLNVHVFARGLLDHLTTRMYFSDEDANDSDPLLGTVEAARRSTLIAERQQREGIVYVFDIVLQGDGETVFFDA